MGPAGKDFFARLAELPRAALALAAFDRLFRQPPALAPYAPAPLLYHTLIGHLLDWLDAPRTAGGLRWEWRPLYQLEAEANPFYFTADHILRRLEQCPPLDAEPRTVLVDILTRFFDLRRTGALAATQATPLVNDPLAQRWQAIFPARFAWRSGAVLKALGLYAVGSTGGYRAFGRYSEGRFESPLQPEGLLRWQAACWEASGNPGDPVALPHQADFLAAAFSGELRALGIDGPCGEAPRCDVCPLRDSCRWAREQGGREQGGSEHGRSEYGGALSGAEIGALARLEPLQALTTEQLLQGVFGLAAADNAALRERLNGASLRGLAGKSLAELEDILGPAAPGPERLALLFELCRRFGDERMAPGQPFKTAWEVYKHFRIRLRDEKQEHIIVVLLDVKKRYLGDRTVTLGLLDTSPIHPREIFGPAIRERAAAILLVHNHPSGDPKPSAADLTITRQLVEAGNLVGIPLVDHVIVGGDKFMSMKDDGVVEF